MKIDDSKWRKWAQRIFMSDLVSDGGIFPWGRKYIPDCSDKQGVVD